MSKESQKEDRTDISRNIEDILLGVFILFGRVIFTFYYYILKPHLFAKDIVGIDPIKDSFPKNYSRPITYFFIALASMAVGFILLFKITPAAKESEENNPFIPLLINAFKQAELTKLIIGLLPFILAVGLYSFSLFWINRKKNLLINFRNSLYQSCYFAGTFFLIYVLIIPIFPLSPSPDVLFKLSTKDKIFFGCAGLVCWAFIIRVIYSYLVLLKYTTKSNRITTLKIFFKGICFFFLVYFLILGWLSPLAFKLMDTITTK